MVLQVKQLPHTMTRARGESERRDFSLLTHTYVCLKIGHDSGSRSSRLAMTTPNVGKASRMDRDRLGRRRGPDQERGLRPLHPLLPSHWTSKALRVAMSHEDWDRFEVLVQIVSSRSQPPTQARAHGEVLTRLMDSAGRAQVSPGPLDWMDWERQKTLRLLRSAV